MPAAPRPTPRRRRPAPRLPPEQRREQLLDTTLELVTDARSFDGVSMEAIARAAGVTKPVVYDFFKNRGELLAGLIEREEQRTLQELAAAIPAPPWLDQDPDDVLVQAIETFLDAVQANPRRWTLVLTPVEGTPEEIRSKVTEIRESVVHLATSLLRVGLNVRGSTMDIDVDLVARMLVGNAEEGARLMLQHPDEYPRERLLGFVRWMAGIVPRGAAYPVSVAESLASLPPDDPARAMLAGGAPGIAPRPP
ncbi:TetR/AcrR family transcriptional regulator, partial [Patulibacter sp. S7RM1-6]